METTLSIDPGATAPIQLTLDPAAFWTALSNIPPNKVGWPSNDHLALAKNLLAKLKTSAGETPFLPPDLHTIAELVFRPSEDAQRAALRQAFSTAGYVLDNGTEATLMLLFSAAQFGDFLSKNENPTTKKSFIEKEKKRGVKKDKFAALIASGAAAITGMALAPGANAQDNAPSDVVDSEETTAEQEVAPEPPPLPPPTPKPTIPKKG